MEIWGGIMREEALCLLWIFAVAAATGLTVIFIWG